MDMNNENIENQNPEKKKKSKKKRRIIIVLIIIIVISLLMSNEEEEANSTDAKNDKKITKTELKVEDKAIRDSVIAELKSSFTTKYDEFTNTHWVEHKNKPKYRNMNGCYCYFQIQDSVASNFRFVFQYVATDWLFIKEMIFNIDGKNFDLYPKMERDNGNGGIWEWCDYEVNYLSSDNADLFSENFVWELKNAKSVKVKLVGQHYSKVQTLSEQQIKSIKETYDYYIALGGKF